MLDQGIISISQAIYYMIREPEPQLQPETDYKLRLFAVNNAIHIHTVRVVCKCKPNVIKLMLPYALCGDVPSRRAIFPYHRHRWSSVVGRCLAAILPIGKYSLILRPPSVSTRYIAKQTPSTVMEIYLFFIFQRLCLSRILRDIVLKFLVDPTRL